MVTGRELTWDMVHYDVQLMGGIQLHLGKIAEMATGEGKTLVATLPLYLNALPGKGAHLVTVNSYLARRDSQWMGHLYSYLGLTVGCLDDTEPGTPERRAAYLADITYGTNNEFGFDYLRDNMVVSLDQRVQRPHVYAIVDEVDSVLIDEARTPLIISGPVGNENDGMYFEHNAAVGAAGAPADGARQLARRRSRARSGEGRHGVGGASSVQGAARKPEEQAADEGAAGAGQQAARAEDGARSHRRPPACRRPSRRIATSRTICCSCSTRRDTRCTSPTRASTSCRPTSTRRSCCRTSSQEVHRIDHDHEMTPEQKIEERRQVEIEYASKAERLNIVHQLLRAHALYERDVNYVVQDGEVLIVDEFTGRTMPGRRWSEGLHQAVEAKEGVRVKGETQTMATITIQNYFRMYDKLAGMTGTAETEETEFFQIYKLEVAVIPTNRPMVREDRHDLVYKTRREKYNAIVEETRRLHDLGFPVLIGTTSVEASETLAKMFSRGGLHAQRAQREVPPARSGDRRRRRTAGRGHDRDEHGRPRNRHQTRRRASRIRSRRRSRIRTAKRSTSWRSAVCTSSAPSATSRGASTVSCAVARAVRAIRARRSSSCRSKTT